jgi:PAS domain S-box-containing protein
VLGKRPSDQSPLLAPQAYMDHLRQAIETGAECSMEIPSRNAKGEVRWNHVRFVPEFGPDGQVVSVSSIGRDIHEIKENEQRFRMLAENFPDFVVRFDRDVRFAYVNPAVSNALDMPADAIVGKTLHQLLQQHKPEQLDAYLAPIRRVFDEGKAHTSEARWDTASGVRIFEVRLVPEKDAGGNVVSVLCIVRDITARRQMERERAAMLRFFGSMDRINRAIQSTTDLEQMMNDALDVVLAVFDCDRVFLLYPCDPQAQAWEIPMERTKPEYPGATALGLEIPMDTERAENFRLLLASDGPVQFGPGTDFPLPKDLAEQFDVKSSMSMALHPKQGQAWLFGLHHCACAHIWTMEEQRLFQEIGRRMEDALTGLLIHRNQRESEERYRMVFENSPVSIWEEDFSAVKNLFDDLKKQGVADIEAWFDRHPETVRHGAKAVKIVDVNRAAVALHGAADKEAIFAGLAQIFTLESLDTFRRILACLWNEGTELIADSVVKTLAGDRRDVSVYFSVCPGYEETLSKVVVSRIDITERKQAEEELALYRDHLEALVQERTVELEASSKELQDFTYSVSHDLRAPLRHIDGFMELLQEKTATDFDEKGRHYMGAISEAARKMGRLIDELLSFTRMGRHALSIRKVDLAELVRDILREFEPETAGRSIDWRIGDLPVASGDGAMLRTALVSLISNALKFTHLRKTARIEIGSIAGQASEAVIFVRDNGVGFDMAYADKLFGVFQRLHREEEFEGTGIGLANVRRIIVRHGGRVWAEGKPDQGATFYFALPQT